MIKLIIWDLDDTLLDTTKDIVPAALKDILQEWKKLDPQLSEKKFHERREQLLPFHSNREIFKILVSEFSFKDSQKALDIAIDFFYFPRLNHPFDLLPGALDNLKTLRQKKYQQILLTAGDEKVQMKKVEGVGIRDYFSNIFVADKNKNSEKDAFFSKFPGIFSVQTQEILSIGNRRQSEIRHAKLAGCHTCLFHYGEHVHEPIEVEADKPDFQVTEHKDVIRICKL